MRYRNGRRGLLSGTILVMLVCSLALGGCGNTGGDDVTINGTVSLSATNAAALGGITFAFSDGTLFGFPGQSATLAWGADGTTFTLTASGGTVIQGKISFGSCTFTQNPTQAAAPFVGVYDTCQVTGRSAGDIGLGGAGNGTITLTLGIASLTPVDSSPVPVSFAVDVNGQITINMNTTPIGVVG